LWSALDEQIKKGKILDYLQIFSFQKDENELLVIHIQEQPKFKSVFHLKYIMKYEEILDKKIYIIDDIDHSTMLFSSEY
jgi:hypothetical protein